MGTITSTPCGTSTIVRGAATVPSNSYYLNSNPSGFITSADLSGRLVSGTAGVSSLNSLTGAVGLVGVNNTIYSSGNNIVISGSASGSDLSNYATIGYVTGASGALRSQTVTGIIPGTNITVSSNGSGGFTVNSTASGSSSVSGVVYTTGNQIISGIKSFVNLLSGTGTITLDLTTGVFNRAGVKTFSAFDRSLYSANSEVVLDWQNGLFYQNSIPSLGYASRGLYDRSGVSSLLWENRYLNDASGANSVDWQNRYLLNTLSDLSIDWQNRNLHYDNSTISLNYYNRILSGDWATNTIPTIPEHIVNYGYLMGVSGALQNSITANTTGLMRLTGSQSVVGDNVFSGANTFIYNGAEVISVPLAQLSVGGIRRLDWGLATLYYGPGEITVLDWGSQKLYNLNGILAADWSAGIQSLYGNWTATGTPSLSGHIVNKGYFDIQTGILATAANLSATGGDLQTQINTLNSWSGSSTGLYYPYSSNPSGFITSGQTGAFGGGSTIIQGSGVSTATGAGSVTINIQNDYDQIILSNRIFN